MSGRLWTEEEIRVVEEMYPDYFASEIAKVLGRSTFSVQRMARIRGVTSSKEKIARSGKMTCMHPNVIASRFQKGMVPHNKGQKMTSEIYEKVRKTMFHKGHIPANYRPVGSERVSKDGYVEVKVADPGKWMLKHRVIWEEAYGEIPDGYNVQFKNGDRQDLRLENLYIIKRADQMANANSIHVRYPEELKAVIRLKGSIKRQITEINKKTRKSNGKEC